jgi:hypothetical protein
VKEYLATLDDTAWGAASDVVPKFVSPSDPVAQWTGDFPRTWRGTRLPANLAWNSTSRELGEELHECGVDLLRMRP